ncbi:polyprenyl synthetase family protein [Saccharopolyspora gloriosae]|uniref:polyprenyl synthetase family protein n=1 Tax=Saccharopolyspora gloriosae TaxID=455344 RepID=UPI001FB6B229|nr:polyprenyl synthetase family protein [Saccharopolyspora gloriosae]
MTTTFPAPPHPVDVDGVRERVDAALARFLDTQEDRYRAMAADDAGRAQWAAAIDTLRTFLIGGKRLRPAFCYWGWRGAGGDPDDAGIIAAAAALELLHAFALIHDDIIDESDTRRGAPSLHRQHADLHHAERMRGSSELFGTSVALLLGDLCLAWFHELLGSSGLPPQRLAAVQPMVAQSFAELVLGQYLDVAEQARSTHSVERACTIIHYKTAKYTIERPLHLGGLLAGADADLLDSYTAYALPLGEAFQLRDDVLGVFGDATITGKPVGDDLRTRKPTVLLATTRRRADAAQLAEIDRAFAAGDLDDDQVRRIQSIIVDSGALAECERLISSRAASARGALDGMRAPGNVRDMLGELLTAATDRAW